MPLSLKTRFHSAFFSKTPSSPLAREEHRQTGHADGQSHPVQGRQTPGQPQASDAVVPVQPRIKKDVITVWPHEIEHHPPRGLLPRRQNQDIFRARSLTSEGPSRMGVSWTLVEGQSGERVQTRTQIPGPLKQEVKPPFRSNRVIRGKQSKQATESVLLVGFSGMRNNRVPNGHNEA